MTLYKFRNNEVAINRLRTHPHHRVWVHKGKVFINNTTSSFIYLNETVASAQPFIYKNSSQYAFKTTTSASYAAMQYGDTITGSYPMSASYRFDLNSGTTTRIDSLRTALDSYNSLSPRYQFSSTAHGAKRSTSHSLISIPSVHFGSKIKKRSIRCRIYMTGSLVGELHDIHGNGELVQVGPRGSTGSGSVAGVALYNEGFLYLSGAWGLSPSTDEYGSGNTDNPKWKYFGAKVNPTKTAFELEFDGTEDIPTMTMYVNAPKGELNCSSNKTAITRGQTTLQHTSSVSYVENSTRSLKNLTYSPHGASGSFEKTTYISSIGIYDEDENLVAIGKLATPIKKRQKDGYTFKLKLDL
jgi:hypothetical protein